MIPGGKLPADRMLREAQALVDDAAAQEQQLELLDPLSAEELAFAQEALGPKAGRMAVLAEARERRRGRPVGSKNKRSDDFERMISQFGPDPAVFLAKCVAETEEAMLERSYANDPAKHRLTWGQARAMRIRAAETLMPYRHGKKPLQVDMSFSGLSDLVIAGVTHSDAEVAGILDAEFTQIEDGE